MALRKAISKRVVIKSKYKKFKGQVAFETILIVGFIFLLLIPLFFILSNKSVAIQDELKTLETSRALSTIASTVTSVGVLGLNNSAVIEFTLPDNIKKISIGKEHPNEIYAVLSTSLGDIHIVKVVNFNISTSIEKLNPGRHKINIVYSEAEKKIIISKI